MDQSAFVRLPRREIPVIGEVDVVVAGASFGGVALACAASGLGRSTWVVEPRTYPGYEVTALHRPWCSEEEWAALPAALRTPLEDAGAATVCNGAVALKPDGVKRGLEDAMFACGVTLLYGSQPVGLVEGNGRVAGVVVGNKSGLQAIVAPVVVDSSPQGGLARLAGATPDPVSYPAMVTARRTIEFTDIEGEPPEALAVPDGMTSIRELRIHPGAAGPGHLLVEVIMELEVRAPGHRGLTAMEHEGRMLTADLARRLVSGEGAFGGARLAWASPELFVDPLERFPSRGQGAEDLRLPGGGRAAVEPFRADDDPGFVPLNAAAFPGEGGRVSPMLSPVPAALVGTRIGERLPPGSVAEPLLARCGRLAAEQGDAVGLREGALDDGRRRRTIPCGPSDIPCETSVDVLVVGGGTSGAVAGAVAAEEGVRTKLLEMNSGLGGTGTLGGIDSYWFGRRVGFTAEVDRRYAAVAEGLKAPKAGAWNIEAKMQALLDWNLEAGCGVEFRTWATGVLMEGSAVRGVVAATPDGLRAYPAKVTIDASGDGDVAAFAGAPWTYGGDRDRLPMWYSLAPFPSPGKPHNNFTSTVDVGNVFDFTRAVVAGRRRWDGYDHAVFLATRESRHVRGGVVLTLTDLLRLRRWPDVVNVCFSNCDIKGKSSSDWVVWGLLPPNCEAEIPYRALVPEGVDGLLVAGRAYSCTHDFLATCRMQADMQNQGGVCAIAGAEAVRSGVEPRSVDVRRVQERLVQAGVLPPGRLAAGPGSWESEDAESLVAELDGSEPFHLDQGFTDRVEQPMRVVRAATAGPEIVPVLERAHAGASGPRKLLLARLLAWYGSKTGVPTLVEAIEAALAGGTLPAKTRKVRFAGVPPDHGVMPEACYLIYGLGLTRDARAIPVIERVAGLFNPALEDFRDKAKGPFYYADASAFVAERLGDPAALPALERLRSHPLLHGQLASSYQTDYILERLAYLELAVARAMARCGSSEGAGVLVEYLGDCRAILARHARDELVAVAGRDFGDDEAAWRRWLGGPGARIAPRPFDLRIG